MIPARKQPESGANVQVLAPVPRKRPAYISEFQPDAVEVEERAPPRLARTTLYLITLLLASATAWACLTEIDEVAVAKGKLITTEPNIVIQPLENSVLRSIKVSVGQVVKAGQVLAVFDPTFTEADVQQLQSRFNASDAMVNRLEAELAGLIYRPSDPASPEQLVEARIAAQRKAFRESRLRNLDEEIARAEASLVKSRKEEAILLQRLKGIQDIETMRTILMEHQTGSKLNLLQARDMRLDIEATIARLQGSQVESGHELEKARSQRQEFVDDFTRATLEALVEARGKRDAAAEELKKAELRRSLVSLTAPADAVVLEVAQRSAGSVMRQAEPLFILVPANVPLEAEVSIAPKDIGHIGQGQTAKIKFDAFPFQKHGTAAATVRTISHDAFPADPKSGEAGAAGVLFHKARLSLDDIGLRSVPSDFRLLPGLSLQAEIQVGRRSVISYFLYPLLRGLDESIREPR
ncbi:HlyD family type I secretion periplasmic adaptor subunit [Microvirga thermotolerans]|uniref:Membrane fusion protein (MFP) family protein n=1 Tax=Microvirga thermotolerans TaxID=2651334 RepID=A0A5P9K1P9_9HYPH|nr:HlyD family type I secretion periplasmic adaptor subunit [Microvirga thermotolerans]QFU17876.1 HlyD family type I secretion periplasmic adaptor subunit [Microvirga thermotolerans]